jgi:hypothetical protein
MTKQVRVQRKTLLVVGEGDTEVAFLKYLRSLYCANDQGASVSVDNAHGKSPENIVECSIRHISSSAYDKRVCLLDTDVPWSPKATKKAKSKKIVMLGASPCIEGLFLEILGHKVPATSSECKAKIATMFTFALTRPDNYSRVFGKAELEVARKRVKILNDLLSYYEAKP